MKHASNIGLHSLFVFQRTKYPNGISKTLKNNVLSRKILTLYSRQQIGANNPFNARRYFNNQLGDIEDIDDDCFV